MKIPADAYTFKPRYETWHKYRSYGSGYVAKRKARTQHICDECNGLIEINEEYYNSTYNDGDMHFTKHICENCWNGIPMKSYNKREYRKDIYEKYGAPEYKRYIPEKM